MEPASFPELPPEVMARIPLFREIQRVLAWTGGPVNWELARQVAVAVAASSGDASPSERELAAFRELAALAEAWVQEATGLEAPPAPAFLFSRSDWAEAAIGPFSKLLEPLFERLSFFLKEDAEGPLAGAVERLLPVVLGVQAGAVLGHLAREVLDPLLLPILPPRLGRIGAVLPNLREAERGYGLQKEEFHLRLLLSTSTRRAFLEGAGWAGEHLARLFADHVREMTFELSEAARNLMETDPRDLDALQRALSGAAGPIGLVAVAGEGLPPLRWFLLLLHASAERVAEEVARARMGGAARSGEALRRISLEPGEGTRLLVEIAGYRIEPQHRARAEAFSARLAEEGGTPLLGKLWASPANLPTPEELADPLAWVARVGR